MFQGNPIFPFQSNLAMFHHGNTNTLQVLIPHYSASCMSNNSSTSDEAEEEHQLRAFDERKRRRMVSNRESARRSRMRKQRQLDVFQTQIARLANENHKLVEKVSQLSQCLDEAVVENATLKEEASDLRQMVSELRIGSPFASYAFRDLEEGFIPCTTAHLRADSSYQWVSSCADLLH